MVTYVGSYKLLTVYFKDGSKDDGPSIIGPVIEFKKEFHFLVPDFVYIRYVVPKKVSIFGGR
jgi:hypothetical protein